MLGIETAIQYNVVFQIVLGIYLSHLGQDSHWSISVPNYLSHWTISISIEKNVVLIKAFRILFIASRFYSTQL